MTLMMKKAAAPEIDPKAFRRALGNFATGVTIITARAPDGTRVGVTASSFNSLSMDPPLILWSSMKDAKSCAIFESASHFAVNILASDQMEMSNHFARRQEDKFAGVDFSEGLGGAPIFDGCAGRFQCETYDRLDGGDHWIFVGRVVKFDDFGRAPLCFHQGSYAMVFNHPDAFPKTDTSPQPDPDRRRPPTAVIEGEVPSLLRRPKGCDFAARCPLAQDACHAAKPRHTHIAPDHRHACLFPLRTPSDLTETA